MIDAGLKLDAATLDNPDGATDVPGGGALWRRTLQEEFRYPATGIDELAWHEVLAIGGIELRAGQHGLLSAQAHVKGPADSEQPILVAPRIACRPSEAPFALGAWTMANWQGVSRQPDGVTVQVNDVFIAPADGLYTCTMELLSGAGAGVPPNTFMTALPGTDDTWLSVQMMPMPAGVRWSIAEPVEIQTGQQATTLERVLDLPAGQRFTVIADVQMSSCPPTAIERGWCTVEGVTNVSAVRARLVVEQLSVAGETPCHTFTDPLQAPQNVSIPNAAHHVKAFHSLSFSADARCARRIRVWTDIEVVSGNPVKVEDRLSSGALTIGGLLVDG